MRPLYFYNRIKGKIWIIEHKFRQIGLGMRFLKVIFKTVLLMWTGKIVGKRLKDQLMAIFTDSFDYVNY